MQGTEKNKHHLHKCQTKTLKTNTNTKLNYILNVRWKLTAAFYFQTNVLKQIYKVENHDLFGFVHINCFSCNK